MANSSFVGQAQYLRLHTANSYHMRPQITLQADTVDLSPLASYVETDVELPKDTLLQRITGKVEYSLLTYIKSLVFYRILKDRAGKLFLL